MTNQPSALSNRQIVRAAMFVLLGFAASGVLGLLRTSIINATFGTGDALDAFYAAQRIPEAIFVLVAGGALGSSFIPVFSRFLSSDDRDSAWRLASASLTLVTLAAAVVALIVALLAGLFVPLLLVPGRESIQPLTVSLTRLMLVTPIIFGFSGLLMGILNAHQRFVLAALAPAMNNVGMIFGALVLTRLIPGDPASLAQAGDANVYGLAWGAILGSLLHLAIQLPGLRTLRGRVRFLPDWRAPGLPEVLVLMGPRVLGLGVVQVNFAVNVAFASAMLEGSITALNTAWFLTFFTLGVIAQSISTAVFPTLSALAAQGDIPGYKERLAGALRNVLFLAFPATIGMIVLGPPLIALIFERGEWTAESTAATAWALAFFAIGVGGHSLLEVLSRAFYALADTRTPVTIGLVAMLANIVLSIIFIRIIGDSENLARGPFAGLALANSLTTIWEGLTLWWLLRRRIGHLNDLFILDGAGRAIIAALGMGVALLATRALLEDSGTLLVAIVGLPLGAGVFFALSLALGIDEARSVPALVLRRLR